MRKGLSFVALAGFSFSLVLLAQFDEHHVKAAFLYNFAKFVEWPPQTFKTRQDPVSICVLGQDSFQKTLEEAVNGKLLEGRRFAVRQIDDLEPKCDCQILFVPSSQRRRFRSMAANLRGSGVLTVGEAPGFAEEGGVINFKLEGDRLRFEINVEAAERERLRISSKLLTLAEIVRK
jgi:hypothetical protein